MDIYRRHYIGILATCIKQSAEIEEVTSSLLHISLISKIFKCEDSSSCRCASETIVFVAKSHVDHIRSTFCLVEVFLLTENFCTMQNITT